MDKKWLLYAAIFLAGVVAANRVRALPGLSSLPSI